MPHLACIIQTVFPQALWTVYALPSMYYGDSVHRHTTVDCLCLMRVLWRQCPQAHHSGLFMPYLACIMETVCPQAHHSGLLSMYYGDSVHRHTTVDCYYALPCMYYGDSVSTGTPEVGVHQTETRDRRLTNHDVHDIIE